MVAGHSLQQGTVRQANGKHTSVIVRTDCGAPAAEAIPRTEVGAELSAKVNPGRHRHRRPQLYLMHNADTHIQYPSETMILICICTTLQHFSSARGGHKRVVHEGRLYATPSRSAIRSAVSSRVNKQIGKRGGRIRERACGECRISCLGRPCPGLGGGRQRSTMAHTIINDGGRDVPLSCATSLKSVPWISAAIPTRERRSASLDDANNIFCFTFESSGDLISAIKRVA